MAAQRKLLESRYNLMPDWTRRQDVPRQTHRGRPDGPTAGTA